MLSDCHSAEEVCDYYPSCQLPAILFGGRPSLVTGPDISVVCMPVHLGRVVHGKLRSAPVLHDPRIRVFGFLAQPRGRTSQLALPILGLAGVAIARSGCRIMLPMAGVPLGGMWWVNTPNPNRELPQTGAIVRAASAAIPPRPGARPCPG